MIASIDWPTLGMAFFCFFLMGIVLWRWGFTAGIARGRELERNLVAQREEQRTRREFLTRA